ncbi:MAG TPA: chloride channel protein [Acidimicrobiales bacterium]|nr:chloride channel protein [Acidimicrobiales bacterium]
MATDAPRAGSDPVRLVLLGAAVGIPAALVGALFLALVHVLEGWLWEDLPDALGRSSPPWYLVVGLPMAGALVVAAARRFLPGDGGHDPVEGMNAAPTPPSHAPGIALAAVGTLAFGLVLGPEAPVIALGSAVGLAITGRAHLDERGAAVLATAGSFSAISALFGGPLVAGVLLVESGLAMGAALLPLLVPGFVAAAVGYVVFTGFGDWGGLDSPGLVVPDLPLYDGVELGDLALAVAVGVATGIALVPIRSLARRLRGGGTRLGVTGLLVAGGLAVGLLAQVGDWWGIDPRDQLFSGQASVPTVVAERSAAMIAVMVAIKAIAYAVSMGCGFRGGAIFPAIFLGIGVASLAVVWFDASPTWAIAVGAAAGTAAETRLVVAPLLLSALLVGTAGLDAAPAAVLAAASAWMVTTALDQRLDPGPGTDPGTVAA